MQLKPISIKDLPEAPKLKYLIGPSFIILGLGLGSGELILWPYLSANYGLGIIWGAIIGITFQFFLNMEVSRYTLINGESIFVGLARKYGIFAPIWMMISTLIPWMWPGIIATAASLFAKAVGFENPVNITIFLLMLIGLIYTLGSVIYKTQEKLNKVIILIGIPFIFILTFILAEFSDVGKLALGIVGKGDGYWFLPNGIAIATFLAAFTYSGAGGNLNLAQSFYVKDKGYGMGIYAERIKGLFHKSNIGEVTGSTFTDNNENRVKFSSWWKKINTEHFLIFWLLGGFTIILLATLAYATTYGSTNYTGINFMFAESAAISESISTFAGTLFLVIAGVMLFGTQFSVYGSTSRIMAENLALAKNTKTTNMSKYFFLFLWLQIGLASIILLLGFKEPLMLVVTGAVLNAFAMFISTILVLLLNSRLKKFYQPHLIRKLILIIAILFYGGFSIYTLIQSF